MRIIIAQEAGEGAAMLTKPPPKKRAVNVFVDIELIDEARRMRINLSETLERRLRMMVRAEQEKRWVQENRAAIDAYNARVAAHGLLSDQAGLL
jgi:antitoxin CcdA